MRRDSRRDYTEFAAVQTKGAFSPQRNRWFADSLLEGTGFEPSVPPRKRRPSREAPRPTIVVSRDDLCLMTPPILSVRHLSSATAERPFTRAGPMVRIRFPPAVSRQTIGSSVAKPHLPFVMSQHSCMPELRLTMPPPGERTKPPIPPCDLLSGALIEVARDTRVCQRVDQDLDHSAFDLSGGEPPAMSAIGSCLSDQRSGDVVAIASSTLDRVRRR